MPLTSEPAIVRPIRTDTPRSTGAPNHQESLCWIDATDFSVCGGWTLDTQYVHLMGAPYLLAQGVGSPVDDASMEIKIPQSGRWHLWVRSRDWLPEFSPGRFCVMVGDAKSADIGKAPHDRWAWQKGGEFDLEATDVTLRLRDLTGWFARVSTVVLTTDPSYRPADDLIDFTNERLTCRGFSAVATEADSGDVVIAGGGVAGCCAALAAARHGARVLLIQDRPVLGGNASVELGVCVDGAASRQFHAREGGIVEECNRRRVAAGDSRWSAVLDQLVAEDPRITLHGNRRIIGARCDGEKIRAVETIDVLTGQRSLYSGEVFVDATGDGWLGYFAGADRMFGREARSRWNESLAPDEADGVTMSGCLLGPKGLGFRAEPFDDEQPFTKPEWAPHFADDASFGREVRSVTGGNWWMEHRGTVDDMWGGEAARDELIRITVGYWDFVKNQWSGRATASHHRLVWIPVSNGRREGFRLEGDHVLTENDVVNAVPFEDAIAHAGWPIDVHHPDGIYSGAEGPFHSNRHVPLHRIPYRCCYSKNIANLFMAGRCLSVSHVALGTVRVQGTLGAVGQAVGTAAAMAFHRGISPREVGRSYLRDLQRQLLKDDGFIPGLTNDDPADLARTATVTASSTSTHEAWIDLQLRGGTWRELDSDYAASFPRESDSPLGGIWLLLRSRRDEPVTMTLHLHAADQPGDFLGPAIAVAQASVEPGSEGWIHFPLSALTSLRYYWARLEPLTGLDWWFLNQQPLDVWSARRPDPGSAWSAKNNTSFALLTHPPDSQPLDHSPQNVINGVSRMTKGASNQWASNPQVPLPQWVELAWEHPVEVNSVRLTFDTDMHRPPMGYLPADAGVASCVSDYCLEAFHSGRWTQVLTESGNILRHRVHHFRAITASRLRLTVSATHGDPSARVFEIRAYRESPASIAGAARL